MVCAPPVGALRGSIRTKQTLSPDPDPIDSVIWFRQQIENHMKLFARVFELLVLISCKGCSLTLSWVVFFVEFCGTALHNRVDRTAHRVLQYLRSILLSVTSLP